MRHIRRGTEIGVLPIIVLVAMLLATAYLQFRWSGDVSEAERDRLQQNLNHSMAGFQLSFRRDLLGICRALQASQPRDRATIVSQLFERFSTWKRISRHAALIDGLYLWETDSHQLWRFNTEDRRLQPTGWPEALASLSARPHRNLPLWTDGWLWDEQIPALIHPVYQLNQNKLNQGKKPARPHLLGYLIVLFDAHYFGQVYLPALARNSFPAGGGFVFQILRGNRDSTQTVIYRSGQQTRQQTRQPARQQAPQAAFAHPDALAGLIEDSGVSHSNKGEGGVVLVAGRPWWWIAVRHRAGSVDAAVSNLHRRDLTISIAVLLVLAASLLVVLVATTRARKLARLQIEFASGVSHELRTPLAVVCAAAANLADGVVRENDRVRDYGEMIRREGQHLSRMVDHILDFAALHATSRNYQLGTVPAAEAVTEAVSRAQSLADLSGMRMQTSIAPGLPPLHTDRSALGQCLENLISNAVKYGSGGKQIEISAHLSGESDHVLITVADSGPGIPAADLPFLFDPFYRGESVRNSPIRGTGLGLSLTREIIEALGGRITVQNNPGKGAAFTLHVPIAKVEADRADEVTLESL